MTIPFKIITKIATYLTLLVVVLFSNCKKDNIEYPCNYNETPYSQSFDFTRVDIKVGDTDNTIDINPNDNHIVWYPEHKTPLPELFIFMPGTNSNPHNYKWIQRAGVFAGYRTIGLDYVNDVSIYERCQFEDPSCSYLTRKENATGEDLSDQIEVNISNSINNRLLKLLQYLSVNDTDPDHGWDDYYTDGQINWGKIIISGHSQGSGQAAFYSKDYEVARALFFSSPGDAHQVSETEIIIAPWSLESRITTVEKMYCLYHVEETSAPKNELIFNEIGMSDFGDPVDVNSTNAPHNCSHILSVSSPAPNASHAHNLPIYDGFIPLNNDGIPIFFDTYMYMLTGNRE